MRRFAIFANQLCCQYDCLFNVRIDGRFTQIFSKYAAKKPYVCVSRTSLECRSRWRPATFPKRYARMGEPQFESSKSLWNSKYKCDLFYKISSFQNSLQHSVMLSIHVFLAGDFSFRRVAAITVRFMPHTSKSFLKERKRKMIANRICALRLHPAWLIANCGHKKRSKMFGRRNPQTPQAGRFDAGEIGRAN